MAIDTLHLFRFVVPKKELSILRDILFENGMVHLRNVSSFSKEVLPSVDEVKNIELNLKKADFLLEVFRDIQPEKKAFIDNFIPKRPLFTRRDIKKIKDENQFDDVYQEVFSISERIKEAQEKIDSFSNTILQLSSFSDIDFNFDDIRKLNRITVKFLRAEGKSLQDLEQFSYLSENSVIFPIYSTGKSKKETESFIVIYASKDHFEIEQYLNRAGFKELDFNQLFGTPKEITKKLEGQISKLSENIMNWNSILKNYANELETIYLWKDFLLNQLDRARGVCHFAETKQVVYIEGFIPAKKSDEILKIIEISYPNVYVDVDKKPDNCPVKLVNNSWVKPFEFLVRMYGIPRFGVIDPTPLIGIVFILLFGIAFADGIYGLSLMAICSFSMKKHKYDVGTVHFFQMFFWAGLCAFIFGALTESWAGDLFTTSYLPSNSFFITLKNSIGVMNPSQNFIAVMVAVIYLGAALQCVAIAMSFCQRMKDKNYVEAIFNNLSWILFIPCAVILAGQFLVPGYYPQIFVTFSQWICLTALIMIFIGGYLQGGKNIIKGIVKGFLNMYGIKSSYGVATLLGDVLSYLRLAALMVATSSMAMSFNLIASMFKSIPVVGIVFTIVMIVFLNIFNFLLNIIGSFVHPVRLLFYEMFSRFYEDGGCEYHAYTHRYRHVFVIEEAK